MTDPTPDSPDLEAGIPELLILPIQIALSAGLMDGSGEAPALTAVRFITITADLRENGAPMEDVFRRHIMIGIDDAVQLIRDLATAVNYHAALSREEAGRA